MTMATFAPSLDIIVPLIMIPWWLPANFLWNVLVIAGTLAAQGVLRSRPIGRLIGYLILTTVLGALVDTVWQIAVQANIPLARRPTPTGDFLRAMPIVIVALGIVNFLLGASLLQLRRRQAVILGCAMGLLTAPWSIVLL